MQLAYLTFQPVMATTSECTHYSSLALDRDGREVSTPELSTGEVAVITEFDCRRNDLSLLAIVALAALGLSACSSTPDTNTVPSSSTVRTTTAPSSHPAVDAYLAMWRDVANASTTSDFRAGSLDDHATGHALTSVTEALREDHNRGVVAKGQPTHSATVSSSEQPREPPTVLIDDCADDSDWLKYRADTGQLVDEIRGGQRAITAEVTLTADGSWKVSHFLVEEVGTCG
ncbi:MAG: hypothetical protein M3443_08605 [Actinomycetota bacterium]|nr:hypothetical protein [Actinomycetota bacterium]